MKHLFYLAFVLSASTTAYASPHNVFGTWVSEAKDGHVEITDCGDGTPCGNLVWTEPKKTDSAVDARNKNKALRTRPLIGVPIIWGFKRSKKGWKGGTIYNPEDGKIFAARVKLKDVNRLQVKGCLGPMCITNIWTRLPSETQTHNK